LKSSYLKGRNWRYKISNSVNCFVCWHSKVSGHNYKGYVICKDTTTKSLFKLLF
jgi:hypothetical protein